MTRGSAGSPLSVWLDGQMDTTGIGVGVRLGLQSWATATSGRVGRIQFVGSSSNAQVQVYFAAPGEVPIGVGANTRVTTSRVGAGNETVRAEIRFSNRFFTEFCPDAGACPATAQSLAAHEMGHALGFIEYGADGQGHTSRTDSIMKNPIRFNAPTAADINTMLTAYGCP